MRKCLPVGLNSSKTVFRFPRSVTVIENTYKDANAFFKQMLILNKKSYIWRLATRDNVQNKISDQKSAPRIISEDTS